MKTSQKLLLTFAFAVSATTVVSGAQAAAITSSNQYGEAVQNTTPDRSITVTPASKWVNVSNGQTVKFTENGKSFEYHFDTLKLRDNFDIAAIAPADMHLQGVHVYVGADPLYRN